MFSRDKTYVRILAVIFVMAIGTFLSTVKIELSFRHNNQAVKAVVVAVNLDHTLLKARVAPIKTPAKQTESMASASNNTCSPSQSSAATYAYSQAQFKNLNETNTSADSIRQAAIVSGESYQDFNSQLNSLFLSYNASIQQQYASYQATLHGCKAPISSPLLFQPYTST